MADKIPVFIPKGSELRQYKVGTAPEGAKYVSEHQLLALAQRAVYSWKPSSEMWVLQYGSAVTGIAAALTGFIFTNHFRRAFKLRNLGFGATMLPGVLIPAIAATIVHEGFVKQKLLTRSFTCPVCAEIRAVSLQCAVSNIQGLVFGFLGCASIARGHTTYKMPRLTDLNAQWAFIKKVNRPLRSGFIMLLGVNALTAAVVTNKEGVMSEVVLSHVQSEVLGGRIDKEFDQQQ